MAKKVLKDVKTTVAGVDLSNHISKVTVAESFNAVEVTSFGSNFKEILQGIGDASITLDFFQDWDASEVDVTLWPLSQSGSPFTVVCVPTSGTVTSTNPSYTMIGVLLSYNPIDGGVGDASSTTVTIQNASQTGIVRGTA